MLSVEKQMLFLLSKAAELGTQDLIRIYEKRGYTAAYIRNALSRLKKDQYVASPSRSMYSITSSGRAYIGSINRKSQHYYKLWDGSWHVVLTAFPETERKRRDQLRTDILQTGFGLLYSGVYISPWPYREEITGLLHKHEAESFVTVISGRVEHGCLTRDSARKIWMLDDLSVKYREKNAWYAKEFEPMLAAAISRKEDVAKAGGERDLELFILYLTLGEQISELYLEDPMLPEELLPPDWAGRHILKKLNDSLEELAGAIPADSEYSPFIS